MTTTSKRDEYVEQVRQPGKFEGEQPYVPYFWEESLNGCMEEIHFADGAVIIYGEIQPRDVEVFPELADSVGQFIALTETDTGFVCGSILSRHEIDNLEKEASEEEVEG
jgi:hypothetical protein